MSDEQKEIVLLSAFLRRDKAGVVLDATDRELAVVVEEQSRSLYMGYDYPVFRHEGKMYMFFEYGPETIKFQEYETLEM